MNNKSDQEFLERSRANFDRSVEALNSQTLARLTKARRAALADLEQTAARPLAWGWLTAGAVATLAAITVTTLLWVQQPA